MFAQPASDPQGSRKIEFPDIPGFVTLKCDFHMHTVLSDGSVWPDIRVQEALRDGLDAISITDHLEYQPKFLDIPHPDRNRGYELALKAAGKSGLLVINGCEITRDMPPGHANAIFVKDANLLNVEDPLEAFREARKQDAFIFWNHPHWMAQRSNGVATLEPMHLEMIEEGLFDGIEIFNEFIYSDEALQIALDHNLTILGTSDIHGLVDYQFGIAEGGHRPVTLVFAREKSESSLKEALEEGNSAVWFGNTLVGHEQFLSPMIEQSIEVIHHVQSQVQRIELKNHSDATYLLENLSDYTFHNRAGVVKAFKTLNLSSKDSGLSGVFTWSTRD